MVLVSEKEYTMILKVLSIQTTALDLIAKEHEELWEHLKKLQKAFKDHVDSYLAHNS